MQYHVIWAETTKLMLIGKGFDGYISSMWKKIGKNCFGYRSPFYLFLKETHKWIILGRVD